MKKKININEVLDSQSALTVQRDLLRHIASAIAAQQGIVAQSADDGGLPHLERQRDDLAAALALGVGDSESLSNIDAEIAQLKIVLADSNEKIIQARSALAGLQRKHDDEAAMLAAMEAGHKTLLLQYLTCEADAVHVAYIGAAREAVSQYLRIIALAELSRSISPNAGDFVPFIEFTIPVSMQLASGAGIKYINDGVLFSSTHVGFFNDIPNALSKLRNDLQRAGLDLA